MKLENSITTFFSKNELEEYLKTLSITKCNHFLTLAYTAGSNPDKIKKLLHEELNTIENIKSKINRTQLLKIMSKLLKDFMYEYEKDNKTVTLCYTIDDNDEVVRIRSMTDHHSSIYLYDNKFHLDHLL